MKDFFTFDEIMRDAYIILGIGFIIFLNYRVTPINLDTVSSGEVFINLIVFIKTKTSFTLTSGAMSSAKSILTLIGVLLAGGTFWALLKLREIHHIEHEKYAPIQEEKNQTKSKSIQWQVVLEHVNSENPAEWKIAVLEADSMLEDVLDEEGYAGDTLGEKLKSASGAFQSYNDAWEAHKVRNQIAHEGASTLDFSKKIAKDAITRFGNVFAELGYI